MMLNIDNDQDFFCKVNRATTWAFMSASTATLLAITVDRYLHIVKPLRYPQIVTHGRLFLAVSGIWITACCIFIVQYIHRRSYGIWLRSVCYLPNSTVFLIDTFTGYLSLILIIFLNFHLLSVARRQRKRIFPETTITSADQSTNRMSFALRFFVVLKEAKTFSVVVAVLTICILTPTVVGLILLEFCTDSCIQTWYVVFHFELYGINSVVNTFIYGMRHVKYRKAYLPILFKLFSTDEKFIAAGLFLLVIEFHVCKFCTLTVFHHAQTLRNKLGCEMHLSLESSILKLISKEISRALPECMNIHPPPPRNKRSSTGPEAMQNCGYLNQSL